MEAITPRIAEICGALIGDGWIESTEKGLYLTGHPTEDKEYYDKHMIPLFSKTFIKVNPKLYSYWRVYGFHTYKKLIIKKIISLGVKKGKKAKTVKLPRWILSSKELMAGALKGLFDTDGCFYCKRCYGKYDNKFRKKYHCQPRVIFNSTSKALIKDVYYIFLKLGFHPEKIKIRKNRLTGGKRYKKDYMIRLNKLDEIKKWFKVSKLSANPKHTTKFQIWDKFGFCPPHTTVEERRKILKGEISINSYY